GSLPVSNTHYKHSIHTNFNKNRPFTAQNSFFANFSAEKYHSRRQIIIFSRIFPLHALSIYSYTIKTHRFRRMPHGRRKPLRAPPSRYSTKPFFTHKKKRSHISPRFNIPFKMQITYKVIY
ncbi:MAG: hypothetical protein MJY99_07145, partial [Fibrobacter sp.]|nr:hypothetical protein [Fibrobacter sp.]